GGAVRREDVSEPHWRVLSDLTSRISSGFETECSELQDADGPSVGIILRERRREVTVEIPAALLTEAAGDATAREAIRVRIKARRDRMLFKAPPSPLPKHIATVPGAMPFGVGRTGGGPRGRRGLSPNDAGGTLARPRRDRDRLD